MESKPSALAIGTKIGMDIMQTAIQSMRKPRMNIVPIMIAKMPHFPKGRLTNRLVTAELQPKRIKTVTKRLPNAETAYTIAVSLIVSSKVFLITSRVIAL